MKTIPVTTIAFFAALLAPLPSGAERDEKRYDIRDDDRDEKRYDIRDDEREEDRR